jgi:hypothetical protein
MCKRLLSVPQGTNEGTVAHICGQLIQSRLVLRVDAFMLLFQKIKQLLYQNMERLRVFFVLD